MNLAWLLSLFLVGLLSSQSLLDLFSSLTSFTIIFKLYKTRKSEQLRLPSLGLEKFFAAWLFVILAGLLYNMQPETPWVKNFLEFRWILEMYFFIVAISVVNPKEKEFQKLLYIILFASVFAIVVYFLKFDPITETWSERQKHLVNYRTGGLLSNPMPFAHSYGALAMLLVGPVLLYSKKEIMKNRLWSVTAMATVIAVFLAFTRGVWIGMVAAIIVMGFSIDWKKGLKVLSALAAVFILAFAVVTPFRERVLFSLNPTKTYDSERITIWKTNFLMFKENPILGLGYSENSRRIREYYDKTGVPKGYIESHAHNQYLHFLAGTGILGFSGFIILIFLMYRMHYQALYSLRKKQDNFFAGLVLGVIGAETCFYIAGFTESNFSIAKNRYMLVLIWSLGCWLWMKTTRRLN